MGGVGGGEREGWGEGRCLPPPPPVGSARSEHRPAPIAAPDPQPEPPPMKGETPVNSTMSIGQARKMVEQLKIEASMCRIKVSKAAADLMTYCDAHACEDPLITPVPTSENPFREKKFFCALL
ncbi:guanine nucleotide-binding protein G(I)/G(S)/G(O) subunit gamma-3 [Grus japonensis]|uniref:Guanine nucleotide-binding protein subunit gamma n=1 Tax=Grus japonensis TaxID=30415 RepID=A0ABC9XWY6_GRUJA